MTPPISRPLRALAFLLRYPDATMRARLPDIHTVLRDPDSDLGPVRRAELDALMDRLLADGLEAEACYVDLFDRGRGTALHLFEHVHGDSRDRGPAMVDLVQTFEAAGLLLGPDELPDHLTVLLEYASTQPRAGACAFIGEFAHILRALAEALRRRHSDYAPVITAILEMAGQPTDDAPAITEDEPLDDSWAEPAAFGGCNSQGQSAPGLAHPASGLPHPVRIIRRPGLPGAAR